MRRAALILLLLIALSPHSIITKADTGQQNEIERVCMIMLLKDYAQYGIVPLVAHFEAYVVCGAAWWVSWLPERLQARWWQDRYAVSLNVVLAAILD